MVVTSVELHGYEEFVKYIEAVDPKGPPILLSFSGSKLPSGESWCPDCVEAEPVLKAYLSELTRDIIFVYVDVGDSVTWKDKACPFRTDPRLKLMVIPTLIRWKGVQRLEGSQCGKRDLLQMLFEDDD
ncbi:hypothetical protein PYW08_004066 [Mythimna loreyi]|uniref:Uncharacterized protein n=1 Tax=Mythimna loreyi TaxID=667449 RepID=A0ACC2QUD6_9NEOP|nr:hypothetical protein PYW08_004066 [Mythimna loreyi]